MLNRNLKLVSVACLWIVLVSVPSSGDQVTCHHLISSNTITQTDAAGTNSFAGDVGIGTTEPAARLHVPAGSPSDLAIGFGTDGDTGFYATTNDVLNAVFGGAFRWYWGPSWLKSTTGGGAALYRPYDAKAPSHTFTDDINTGMGRSGANELFLMTAGTNAVTVDASQNVGIGTNDPSAKLHVAGSLTVSGAMTVPKQGDVDMGDYTNGAPTTGATAVGAAESCTCVCLSTNQAITNNTWTPIAFDTEDFDPGDDFDTSTYKFVCPSAGKYWVTVHVRMEGVAAADWVGVRVKRDSAIVLYHTHVGSSTWGEVGGTKMISCSANDELTAEVWHNIGSTQDLKLHDTVTHMSITRVW